jgi:hypothetical protein
MDTSLYIVSHSGIREHRKTKRLARLLNTTTAATIGHLHCLWWAAMTYCPDGDLTSLDAGDVADAGAWEGDPETFLKALRDAGWIDGRQLHDWDDYGGKVYAKRLKDAERKRRGRAPDNRATTGARPADVQRTGRGRGPECPRPSDVRVEKSKEEKSREDQEHCPTESASDVLDGEIVDEGFDAFWATYPRKEGKRATLSLWQHARNGTHDRMAAASRNYGVWAYAHADSPLMLPTTFLSKTGGRWEEWEHGPPPGRDRAPARSGRAVDSAFGAIKALASEMESR